jgi:hypothetical protein
MCIKWFLPKDIDSITTLGLHKLSVWETRRASDHSKESQAEGPRPSMDAQKHQSKGTGCEQQLGYMGLLFTIAN